MTKLADELERLAKAIRTAIEYMPYLDRQKEDDDGDYLPLTLREFYEETWQGSYADELFQDVENVIITALRQPDAVPGDLVSLTAERDAALARVAELEAALQNPPPHRFWGAGELDCPRELKAGNGELHTMMCKVCGVKNPLDNICRALLEGSRP